MITVSKTYSSGAETTEKLLSTEYHYKHFQSSTFVRKLQEIVLFRCHSFVDISIYTGMSEQVLSLRKLLGPERGRAVLSAFEEVEDKCRSVLKHCHDWELFMKDLKPPLQWNRTYIETRICSNLLFFRCNYFVIMWAALFLGVLLNPVIIFAVTIVVLWYVYFLVLLKGPMMVAEYEVDPQMRLVICTISACAFFTLTGALEAVFWSLICGVLACVLHMLIRSKNHSMLTCRAQEDLKLALFTVFVGGIDGTHSNLNYGTTHMNSQVPAGMEGGAYSADVQPSGSGSSELRRRGMQGNPEGV